MLDRTNCVHVMMYCMTDSGWY